MGVIRTGGWPSDEFIVEVDSGGTIRCNRDAFIVLVDVSGFCARGTDGGASFSKLLWDEVPLFFEQFRNEWAAHGPGDCGSLLCKKAMIADGHFKVRRACCENENGGFIECEYVNNILALLSLARRRPEHSSDPSSASWSGPASLARLGLRHSATLVQRLACAQDDLLRELPCVPVYHHARRGASSSIVRLADPRRNCLSVVAAAMTPAYAILLPRRKVVDESLSTQEAGALEEMSKSISAEEKALAGTVFHDNEDDITFTIHSVKVILMERIGLGEQTVEAIKAVYYYPSEVTAPGAVYAGRKPPINHRTVVWTPLDEVKTWLVEGTTTKGTTHKTQAAKPQKRSAKGSPKHKSKLPKPHPMAGRRMTRSATLAATATMSEPLPEYTSERAHDSEDEEDVEERKRSEADNDDAEPKRSGRTAPSKAILTAVTGIALSPDGTKKFECRWSNGTKQIIDRCHVPRQLIASFEDQLANAKRGKEMSLPDERGGTTKRPNAY